MNDNNFQDKDASQKGSIKPDGHEFKNPYSCYYSSQKEELNDHPDELSEQNTADPFDSFYREDAFADPLSGASQPAAAAPMIDETLERRNLSRIGGGYALFTAVSFFVSLVIQVIVLTVSPKFYETSLFLNLITPVSLYIFALPILLIVLTRCEAKPPKKQKMGFGAFMLFLITSFGFMYIGSMIGNKVMDFLSKAVGYDYSNALNRIVDNDNIWITAIFTVVVAPIGEEFVFRKLIIDRTQKYGGYISIGLSALIFGLMHGNLYQFFYCFLLGILLGYIYYSTGKLYITIAIHSIVNFVGSVLTSLLMPISEGLLEMESADPEIMMNFMLENIAGIAALLLFSLFTYAAMACAVIFPIVFRKKIKLGSGEVSIPKGKIISIVILNVGVIVMLTFYLLEFGLNLLPL